MKCLIYVVDLYRKKFWWPQNTRFYLGSNKPQILVIWIQAILHWKKSILKWKKIQESCRIKYNRLIKID